MRQTIAYLLLIVLACSCLGFQAIVVKHRITNSIGSPQVTKFSCASATTCVPPSLTIATNDTVFFECWAVNADSIISVSNIGTVVDDGWRSGRAGQRFGFGAHTFAATARTGTVTITFAQTTGGVVGYVWDYPVTGTAPTLDTIIDTSGNHASPFTIPAMTLSGSKDMIIASGSADANITALASPFNANALFQNPTGSGDNENVSTSGSPSFTAAGMAIAQGGMVAFGQTGVTACDNRGFIDFSGGTATNNPLKADLVSSTHNLAGFQTGTLTDESWLWTVTGGTHLVYQTAANHAIASPPRPCWGGTYTDSSTLGLRYTMPASPASSYVELFFPDTDYPSYGVSATATASFWFETSAVGSNTCNFDAFTLNANTGDYVNFNPQCTGSSLDFHAEFSCGSAVTVTGASANHWYLVALQLQQSGTNKMTVYDSDGITSLGASTHAACGSGSPWSLYFGESAGGTNTSSITMDFGAVQACSLGTCLFPLMM